MESIENLSLSHHCDLLTSHANMLDPVEEINNLCQQCLSFEALDEDDDDSSRFEAPGLIVKPSTITKQDLIPSSLLIAHQVQDQVFARPLKALFDSGSNISLLNASCLPAKVQPDSLPTTQQGITAAGIFESRYTVIMRELVLPEFTKTKRIREWKFYLFNARCPYDVILGRDFLLNMKIDPCFSTRTVKWEELTIPFKPRTFWNDPYNIQTTITHFTAEIQASKYEHVSVQEVASQQTHLTLQQQQDLANVLIEYPKLFSGELGLYPHRKVHLELIDGAQPIHLRPYSVAKTQESLFKILV